MLSCYVVHGAQPKGKAHRAAGTVGLLSMQGAPGQPGGSGLFMPQGAVGVFELPTEWAVVQQQAHVEEPVIDT